MMRAISGWGRTRPPYNTPLNWADTITKSLIGYWIFGQHCRPLNLANAKWNGAFSGYNGLGTVAPTPVASIEGPGMIMSSANGVFINDNASPAFNFTTPGVFSMLYDFVAATPTTTSVFGSRGDFGTPPSCDGWILQGTAGVNGGLYLVHLEMGNATTMAEPGLYCITPGKLHRMALTCNGSAVAWMVNGLPNASWTLVNVNSGNGLGTAVTIAPTVPSAGFDIPTNIGCHHAGSSYVMEHKLLRVAFWDRVLTAAELTRLTLLDPYGLHKRPSYRNLTTLPPLNAFVGEPQCGFSLLH